MVEPMPKMLAPKIFQKWGGDVIGPLTPCNRKWYVIFWTDYHSKWVVSRAVSAVSEEQIVKTLLEGVILEHRFPKEIVTDRGVGFIGDMMIALNKQLMIRHRKTTAYHPQLNGLAERMNKTMIEVMSKLMMEYDKRWVEVLKWAVWVYNMTTRKSTGYEPFYLKYGMRANLLIDMEITTYVNSKESEVGAVV